QPVEIKSRDGKALVSYLTLPPSAGERPAQPLPMVLMVHGGPWARDTYGYDGYAQFIANRGYAVLQVNFRGSTGFGKGFVNAGDGEWAGKMHDDLIDAVNWAVKGGFADPKRVAIMGGSYGGYATLVGLTFTPETFACGVDIVGPSNLFTLLSTVPPYWEAFRQQLFRRVGNPETPEGQAFLKERSPLTHVERIRRPLLIGQGANDPRVRQDESDQIVAAMQKRSIPVTYVLFPDEGHGFARPANNIAFMAVVENFLSQCIGGRAEPIGATVAASTAQVPHGAQYAPGLKEALSLREGQPTAAR
ncbi:MAG: alpha/beta hydrolase family protein, partial [Thermaurantiacus sp.]